MDKPGNLCPISGQYLKMSGKQMAQSTEVLPDIHAQDVNSSI